MAKIQGFGGVNPTDISWQSVQLGANEPGSVKDLQQAQWGAMGGTNAGHPALPALWWLGFVILLVAWRVLDSLR